MIPKGFDLAQTLECGQCFRWERQEDGAYRGVVKKRVLRVRAGDLGEAAADPFWRSYFDLDRDYPAIRRSFAARGGALARAAAYAPGIHILNQEPWEALCTFIISQNNNIPRIRGIVARLCAGYGDPLEDGLFAFPPAEAIAGAAEADLRAAGCGFRAPYLLDAARRVATGEIDLERLRGAPLEQSRAELMRIRGVGPKVADCTLLYGLHRLEAFPEDVWIRRAMRELFPGWSAADFGDCAGIAQQYIFHYIRTGGDGHDGGRPADKNR